VARIGCGHEDRPSEHVQHGRTKDDTDENFAEHDWLMNSRRERSGDLRRGNDHRQQEQDLQRVCQGQISVCIEG
jgi:hypothetical protein